MSGTIWGSGVWGSGVWGTGVWGDLGGGGGTIPSPTALIVQPVTVFGRVFTYVPANEGGNYFQNTGNCFVLVKNGDSSPMTVTITSKRACTFGATHNYVIAVPAGREVNIGPLPIDRFSRQVDISYSSVTSVTVAVGTL